MNIYDALEAAYKNGFIAGSQSRDKECGTWQWDEVMVNRNKPVYAYRCSECDERVFIKSPYCPYCGTKINLEV